MKKGSIGERSQEGSPGEKGNLDSQNSERKNGLSLELKKNDSDYVSSSDDDDDEDAKRAGSDDDEDEDVLRKDTKDNDSLDNVKKSNQSKDVDAYVSDGDSSSDKDDNEKVMAVDDGNSLGSVEV